MEYFENGDLSECLSATSPLPEQEVQDIIFQVLEGVTYMHQNEFAHRDLKPKVFLHRYIYSHTHLLTQNAELISQIAPSRSVVD